MPDVLVRNVDEAVIERLKARASNKHRSLQAELQLILKQAAHQLQTDELQVRAAALRRRLGGRSHTDSAVSVAEDRER